MILIAAVSGGAFGLQYRVMRKYTADNTGLLSMFFATIVVPLIAIHFILPGWTDAVARVGLRTNLLVFLFGFGWGLGATTYAYGFSLLGMALAASLLKGISIAVGSGIPLIHNWEAVPAAPKVWTIVGIVILMVGTAIAGKAGIMRERESGHRLPGGAGAARQAAPTAAANPTVRMFWLGMICCLISGIFSGFANLGYDFAKPLEIAMGDGLKWRATLIRWMPMYWGGITGMAICMGGNMIRRGTWRNYFAPGSLRDGVISSTMGGVHFMAQIPYGIGAFYLGTLGTTVGWGVNIGMALVVATTLGFISGEWRHASIASIRVLLAGIVVLLVAMLILAYANSLAA